MPGGGPRRLDYDFLSCRIIRETGWTLEYVFNLTWPVFMALALELVPRMRADAAIDEMYRPYVAAKAGGEASDRLFRRRGSFFLGDEPALLPVTPEALAAAQKKIDRIKAARQRRNAG